MPFLAESVPPNPALQAQIDAQAGMIATLSQRHVDLLARVSELNMQMARQTLETALDTGRQLAACTDPLQLGAIAMHGWQPLGEHVRSYQQNMMGMLAEAQAGLANAPVFAAQPTARKST